MGYKADNGLVGDFAIEDLERFIVQQAASRGVSADTLNQIRTNALAGNLSAQHLQVLQEIVPVGVFVAFVWRQE